MTYVGRALAGRLAAMVLLVLIGRVTTAAADAPTNPSVVVPAEANLSGITCPRELPPNGRPSVEQRAIECWQAKRFGMFVHWGPVSLKGTEIGWSRGAQVPTAEYDQLYKHFNPRKFDAAEWVAVAKAAGMKYLVITSKHHDGFCLWDSKHTDYDIMASPYRRDILKELSVECKRQGVQFCTYYSICDWHHPDYPTDSPGGRRMKATHNMPRYFQFLKSQTKEILDNYGPLGVMWFDGEWEKPWTPAYGKQLYDYLKRIQPDLVINNRVGKGRQGMAGTTEAEGGIPGDYDTPEQRIGGFDRQRPWETCMTICRQWAWKPNDEMKSLGQCLNTLLQVVGGDGNLLFNVGPMPDGRIEPRQVERLKEMGRWLAKYGEGVYGTRGGPFMPGRWGAATCTDNRIYLFVMNWPEEGPLKLPRIDKKITSVRTLSGGEAKLEQTDQGITVGLGQPARDPIATVIQLTVDGKAFEVEPVRVFLYGRPLAIKKATASNVFRRMAEYAPGKAIDNDPQTRWATDADSDGAWLEVDLGEPKTIARARIAEAYAPRVQQFELQAKQGDSWKTFARGNQIGRALMLKFKPVTAEVIRLNILKASEGPTIWELQLFSTARP